MRRSFVQINGVLYEKGVDEILDDVAGLGRAATVMGDVADFVSPIDGSLVSGRAGLREHCKRHNVVLTEDLKGLPPKPMTLPIDPQYREQTKQNIADIINSRGYFRR